MHKLSICINVKNRSLVSTETGMLHLFPECVKSINSCINYIPLETELIIADWESTDWPIRTWIGDYLTDTDVHLITVKGKHFNHGKGKNIAAEYASGDILFFLDADLLLVPEVFERGLKVISKGSIYCPIFEYCLTPDCTKSDWSKRPGCLLLPRETFYKAGKWPEYKRWGLEDFTFIEILQNTYKVHFNRIPGFKHQWHPQDIEWKNRYTDPGVLAKQEQTNIQNRWQALADDEEKEILDGLKVISKQAIEKIKKTEDNIGKDIPRIGDIWK